MVLRLDYAARSHVGLVRQGNEDSAYAGPHLLVVADGMGGHAAGEVASAAVVRVLADLEPELTAAGSDPVEGLREGITAAGHELRRISDASPDVEGMGTTVTVLLQVGDRVAVAQVGDSRAYLLRDGVLEQLTHDQTFVQTLVDEGRLHPDEAASHPQRSLLLQALDGRFDVEPEVGVRAPASGDRYLVCSDGLSGVLSEATLRDVLAEGTPQEAVGRLVDLALRAGAPDNVTGIVADVVSDDAAEGGPALLVGAVAPPAGAAHRADVADQPDADEAESAAGSAEEPARRRIGLVLPLVLLVALVAVGGWLGYRWTQDQYYVGADEDQVVIFQGVSGTVAGRSLSRIVEPTDLEVADLPEITQQQVEATIAARDLADARAIVARLREEAASCATATPLPAGCPPRPTPSSSPTLTPSPTPTPAPTTAPTASPAVPG